ncbi:hypothetical protein EWM64_g925 [Hericium alpestre]|uniref:Uncharacterized protein n=1 Tax=Hericium alpestre TaxID=135208 RepID=A0A4Z0A8L3_9AGAM|nr:hypothetical protein EWM64_g925 [Hericium alpestre]
MLLVLAQASTSYGSWGVAWLDAGDDDDRRSHIHPAMNTASETLTGLAQAGKTSGADLY